MRVNGKTALVLEVVGPESWRTAQRLAAAGARLVAHDSADLLALERRARELHSLGHDCLPIIADLTQAEQREALVRRLLQTFGRLDLVVLPLPSETASFLGLASAELAARLSHLAAGLSLLRDAARQMASQIGGGQIILLKAESHLSGAAYRRFGMSLETELVAEGVEVGELSATELIRRLEPRLPKTAAEPHDVWSARVRHLFLPESGVPASGHAARDEPSRADASSLKSGQHPSAKPDSA